MALDNEGSSSMDIDVDGEVSLLNEGALSHTTEHDGVNVSEVNTNTAQMKNEVIVSVKRERSGKEEQLKQPVKKKARRMSSAGSKKKKKGKMKDEKLVVDFENVAKMILFANQVNDESQERYICQKEFADSWKSGDNVDVRCNFSGHWLPAKIVDIQGNAIQIHYMGWHNSFDIVLDRDTHANVIAPSGMFAKPYRQAVKKKSIKQEKVDNEFVVDDDSVRENKDNQIDEGVVIKEENQDSCLTTPVKSEQTSTIAKFKEVGSTRSGRKVTTRINLDPGAKRIIRKSTVNKEGSCGGNTNGNVRKNRSWIDANLCHTCLEVEDEALSDVVLCDGPCLRNFHFSCVGLIEPPPADEKWYCEECVDKEYECFICNRTGTLNEKAGVFPCSLDDCGKFYHLECVHSDPFTIVKSKPAVIKVEEASCVPHIKNEISIENGQTSASTNDIVKDIVMKLVEVTVETCQTEQNNSSLSPNFVCPWHRCHTCEKSSDSHNIMCCLRCSEAYHFYCVPPSARYSNVGMLCKKHDEELPTIPPFYMEDAHFDSLHVDGKFRLPALYLPSSKALEKEDESSFFHFRIPNSILRDIQNKPPHYQTLRRNKYLFKEPKEIIEDSPVCVCKDKCGDDCINRCSITECFGPGPKYVSKDANGRVIRKESNCNVGKDCGNRALHQRVYPRTKIINSAEKGWGLKVLENVKAGNLVIEYVGEVINEEMKDKRLREHELNHPEDHNMYIMQLNNQEYIDARHKGSVSRFINHSCDPNCHLVRWCVKGITRISISALKDISAGDELSYDYQFHTSKATKWKCHCKSKNCRGTLAPINLKDMKNSNSQNRKKKKLSIKEMRKKVQSIKLKREREAKADLRRLSLTASLVAKERGSSSYIRPVERELKHVFAARNGKIFLTRNIRTGFDFLTRKKAFDERVGRGRIHRKNKAREAKLKEAEVQKIKKENGDNKHMTLHKQGTSQVRILKEELSMSVMRSDIDPSIDRNMLNANIPGSPKDSIKLSTSDICVGSSNLTSIPGKQEVALSSDDLNNTPCIGDDLLSPGVTPCEYSSAQNSVIDRNNSSSYKSVNNDVLPNVMDEKLSSKLPKGPTYCESNKPRDQGIQYTSNEKCLQYTKEVDIKMDNVIENTVSGIEIGHCNLMDEMEQEVSTS